MLMRGVVVPAVCLVIVGLLSIAFGVFHSENVAETASDLATKCIESSLLQETKLMRQIALLRANVTRLSDVVQKSCVATNLSATELVASKVATQTAEEPNTIGVRPKHWFQTWKTERKASLLLYQMVDDLHNLFCGFGVLYWATAGTLLGAERNRGMIPWDDDVDVVIRESDRSRIVSKAFNREADIYGYKMVRWGPIYRLYHKKSNAEGHGWPFIEVWVAKRAREVRRLICKNGPGGNKRPPASQMKKYGCSWNVYHDVYQSIKMDQVLKETPVIEVNTFSPCLRFAHFDQQCACALTLLLGSGRLSRRRSYSH